MKKPGLKSKNKLSLVATSSKANIIINIRQLVVSPDVTAANIEDSIRKVLLEANIQDVKFQYPETEG